MVKTFARQGAAADEDNHRLFNGWFRSYRRSTSIARIVAGKARREGAALGSAYSIVATAAVASKYSLMKRSTGADPIGKLDRAVVRFPHAGMALGLVRARMQVDGRSAPPTSSKSGRDAFARVVRRSGAERAGRR